MGAAFAVRAKFDAVMSGENTSTSSAVETVPLKYDSMPVFLRFGVGVDGPSPSPSAAMDDIEGRLLPWPNSHPGVGVGVGVDVDVEVPRALLPGVPSLGR